MTPFKRSIPQILRLPRLPSKFRRFPFKSDNATVSMDTPRPCAGPDLLCKVPDPAPNPVPLPSTVAGVNEVAESEELVASESVMGDVTDAREDPEDDNPTEVNDVEAEEFGTDDVDVDSDAEDEDPCAEIFPFDLAHKTRIEMMIHRLYVALSDDAHEIADLRTRASDRFTHIVRVTFDPPSLDSDATLSPSAWKHKVNTPADGPVELHLQCPDFVRRNECHTALTRTQLLFACKFITTWLPYRHDALPGRGVELPSSEEERADTRLLVVGPADRTVDVMAILVCYLTSLTGAPAAKLLDSLKKLDFEHSHWKNYAIANFAVASVTSNTGL